MFDSLTEDEINAISKSYSKRLNNSKKGIKKESKDIRNPIIAFINSLPNAYAVIFPSTSYRSRNPDILAVVNGVPFLLECKADEKEKFRQELSQACEVEKWRKAGAIAKTVTSLNEVKELIKQNIKDAQYA